MLKKFLILFLLFGLFSGLFGVQTVNAVEVYDATEVELYDWEYRTNNQGSGSQAFIIQLEAGTDTQVGQYTGRGCVINSGGGCTNQVSYTESLAGGTTIFIDTTSLEAEIFTVDGALTPITIDGTENVEPPTSEDEGAISADIFIPSLDDLIAIGGETGPLQLRLIDEDNERVATINIDSVDEILPPGFRLTNNEFTELEPGDYEVILFMRGEPEDSAEVEVRAADPTNVTLEIDTEQLIEDIQAGIVEDVEPTCLTNIGGLGFILCPFVGFLLGALDGIVGGTIFGSILEFDMLTSRNGALRSIWAGFRNISSIGFVIVFMLIVFSQASGTLLKSYDIKRLLPRLLVGAIAVQLSFFICVQLVDLFNALGSGVADLMLAPVGGGGINNLFADTDENLGGVRAFAEGLASVLTIIVMLIGFIFALYGIFLMLIVFMIRNLVLVVMAIISPLAFVAWILPNTEQYFKKWWKLFIQLLSMYPIAMAFLASGKLLAAIWASGDGFAARWLGIVAMFAPYVFAPKMFQFAGSSVNGMMRGVNNASTKVRGSTIGSRTEARAKGAAANKFAGTKIGQKASKSGAVRSGLARKIEAARKLDDEDMQSSIINQKREATAKRAAATAAGTNADDAERQHYLEILKNKDGNRSESERRAAFRTLTLVHTNNEEVATELTNFIQDARATTSVGEQRLAEKMLEDNMSSLLKDLPQAVKGYEKSSEQKVDKVIGIKSGAIADMRRHVETLLSAPPGSAEHAQGQRIASNMGARFAEGGDNDNIRGRISTGHASQTLQMMQAAGMDNTSHPDYATYKSFEDQYDISGTTATLKPR